MASFILNLEKCGKYLFTKLWSWKEQLAIEHCPSNFLKCLTNMLTHDFQEHYILVYWKSGGLGKVAACEVVSHTV